MRSTKRVLTLIALTGALVSVGPMLAAAKGHAMMAPIGKQEARVTILSPGVGDHLPAAGWDVQIQVVVPAKYMLMVSPALIGPTSPYFKPGPSHAFPGLVVTDTGTSAKMGGASQNLAGLFQVVGVQHNFQGDTVIEADWLVGKPMFSALSMPCIRAYVVAGKAPSSVATPPTNKDIGAKVAGHTLLSNVAKVDGTIAGASSGM